MSLLKSGAQWFLGDEQRWAVRCEENYDAVNAKPANLKRVDVQSKNEILRNPLTGGYMRPAKPEPVTDPTTQVDDLNTLHEAVLYGYYQLRKGGMIVSCGDRYMIAIEFDGAFGEGGVCGPMTFVDNGRKSQAVLKSRKCNHAKALGRNFLLGETVVYFDTVQESIFFDLLKKYKCRASYSGYIDAKSGLDLFQVSIRK
ncbi:MAG: hypothetical protein SGBAC_013355 [Bacillariaceae sp.]